MAYRLPPLSSLRLFEAAGRNLSFKLAARELGITASAVSHGIQSLELWLGTPLFARTSRGLTLTDAGGAYLPAVHDALALLASAGDRLPAREARAQLAISVPPTFGARLLLPRLASFTALHPSIKVTIDTSHQPVEFPRHGADLAVRMGRGSWPGLAALHLLAEELVPVAAPALAAKLPPGASLCDAPLIHLTTASEDWGAWAERAGLSALDCKRGLMVDTIQMAMDAAAGGLGIAIGRRPIVDAELRRGRLVTLGRPAVPARTAYWLVGTHETIARPEIATFSGWLIAEMKSVADGSGSIQMDEARHQTLS